MSTLRDEVERVRRVSDLRCSGHANLRERFAKRALILDLAILGLSTWLVALAFIEPTINVRLTPFHWDTQMWGGLLAIGTFFLTIVQFKTDWKSLAEAHKRTLDLYAEVKREVGYLLASEVFTDEDCRRVLTRYDMASAIGLNIKESEFLPQKRRHLLKIAASKRLDTHPSTAFLLFRIRIWLRDNLTGR